MVRYLVDADAFLALRSLGLIQVLRTSDRLPRPIVCTSYIARHELSSIDREIGALEAAGVLQVESVPNRDPDLRRLRGAGADRGEAEAIAWALSLRPEDRPIFVSLDVKARRQAEGNGVPAGDLMDLLVDLVDRGVLALEDAERHASPWEDQRQQRGRPRDFSTFAETFARRRAARAGAGK